MYGSYVVQAKVVRAVSVHGTYELLANEGPRFITAIALSETSSALFGAHTSSTYPNGSWVVVFVPEATESGSSMGLIIGAGYDTPVGPESPYNVLSVLDNNCSFLIKNSTSDVSLVPEDTKMENNFSNGSAS